MIKNISIGEKAIVTLLPGVKHPYEDGELVLLSEIEGMVKLQSEQEEAKEDMELDSKMVSAESINGTIHKIRVINSNSFEIGDTRGFSPYVRSGIAKNIKAPVNLQFKSLQEVWNTNSAINSIDENLGIHDFEKFNNPHILFIAFHVLDAF